MGVAEEKKARERTRLQKREDAKQDFLNRMQRLKNAEKEKDEAKLDYMTHNEKEVKNKKFGPEA